MDTDAIANRRTTIDDIRMRGGYGARDRLDRDTTTRASMELKTAWWRNFDRNRTLLGIGEDRSNHLYLPSREMDGKTYLKERVAVIYPTNPVFTAENTASQKGFWK